MYSQHLRSRQLARQQQAGFTLVELMVTLTMLAVLATLAAPNLGGIVTARQVEGLARRFADDMSLARNEAIKRNAAVLLCADSTITDGSCAAAPTAADWAKGWRVCYDADDNDSCDTGNSSNPNPIRQMNAPGTALALTGPVSRLRFNPNGSVSASAFTAVTARSAGSSSVSWSINFAASGALSIRKS